MQAMAHDRFRFNYGMSYKNKSYPIAYPVIANIYTKRSREQWPAAGLSHTASTPPRRYRQMMLHDLCYLPVTDPIAVSMNRNKVPLRPVTGAWA